MINVRLFASARDAAGKSDFQVDFLAGQTVGHILARLKALYPSLAPLLDARKLLVSVNQEFAELATPLHDGDEVALLPPFSGGDTAWVRIQEENFSVEDEVERVRASSTRIGGIVTFLGTARDFSRDHDVSELFYEHYPGMAEKKLAEIRKRALEEFDIIEAAIVHRTGRIPIGENIVLIVVGASHRREAFAACTWCVNELKRITPIWKRETTPEGLVWVEEHP